MSKIELRHDILAREIFINSSDTLKVRRELEPMVKKNARLWFEAKAGLLRGPELTWVMDNWNILRLTSQERQYVWASKEARERELENKKKRRRRLIASLVTLVLVFAALAAFAFIAQNRAVKAMNQTKAMETALASRYALYEGYPSKAFRLAQAVKTKNKEDDEPNRIADEVLTELAKTPLVSDFIHNDVITAIQFDTSGNRIMTASLDGTVLIRKTRRDTVQLFNHSTGVTMALFSDDSQLLATATEDHKVTIWITTDSQKVLTHTHNDRVNEIDFSDDGRYMLSASSDGTAQLFDLAQARATHTCSHQGAVSGARFFRQDGRQNLLTVSADSTAILWNLKGEQVLSYKNVLNQPFTGVDIAPSGKRVLFNTPEGDFMLSPKGDSLTDPTSVFFSAVQPRLSKFVRAEYPERIISYSRDSAVALVFRIADDTKSQKEQDQQIKNIEMQFRPKEPLINFDSSPSGRRLIFSSESMESVFFEWQKAGEAGGASYQVDHRFNCKMTKGAFPPNEVFYLSTDGGNVAHFWRFPPLEETNSHIDKKKAAPLETIIGYYNTRLAPLK